MTEFMSYDFLINNIVLACFVPAGQGTAIHIDRASHGLALNTAGEKEYYFSDGKVCVVKENDIIYLPKHSTYNVVSKISGDCYAINFDISENIAFSPFALNIKKHDTVTKNFQSAKKAWQQKKNGYNIKCKAELYNIIYAMQQEYFAEYFPSNKQDIIKPAVDYIHEKYASERMSVEALAEMCNITPGYLRKNFKLFYGVSPINYINNLKITRARELLKSQMYSVTDAAKLSGFNEMSYFSREFKKVTGLSPVEYKNSAWQ